MSNIKNLSIILPVHNERKTIEYVLREWSRELKRLKLTHEFIICEDGSTDGTDHFLKKIKSKYKFILDQKTNRRGYGGAIIDGIRLTRSQWILSIDSDGQCDPKDFEKFWKNRNKADILIGWRTDRADSFQRKTFSKLFKTVFTLLFPSNIHDPSTPFVLYKKRDLLPNLKYLKYMKEGFWWGFVGTVAKKGLSIYELTVNHRKRLNGVTVVYQAHKIPSIAVRNLIGLVRLKLSK
jgi:glycosyltransferase involved in cell wall biosynthesis